MARARFAKFPPGYRSPALLQSYLDRYPNGNFSGLARAMLKEMSPAAGPSAPAKRAAFIHRRQSRTGAFAANGASARGLRSRHGRRQMAEQDTGGADAVCASGQTGPVHRKTESPPLSMRCAGTRTASARSIAVRARSSATATVLPPRCRHRRQEEVHGRFENTTRSPDRASGNTARGTDKGKRRRHVLGGGAGPKFRVRAVQRPSSAPKGVLSGELPHRQMFPH